MLALKIIVSVAFVLAGGAKLVGAKPLAEQFREFGLPRAAMHLVGALEIAGAIGLFVDSLALWATLGLATLMAGALANHLKAKHSFDKFAPALVLLGLTLALTVVLWI